MDQRFLTAFEASLKDALAARECEAALRHLTGLALETIGDGEAAARPGALKPGERDYRVAGVFVITPDRKFNMLVANIGFPPEQRRLAIPIGWNHPGEVVATRAPLLLENTDTDQGFRQFLKTSRMGSAMYVPMFRDGEIFGQIVAAAQARWTYGPDDLRLLREIARAGELVWLLRNGPAWLAADYPAPDLWDASRASVDE